jgi:uncharacterized protein (UPF0332 family)
VTPETGYFLKKRASLLVEADAMLKIDLYDAAGRTAYLAGFHAAQLLFRKRPEGPSRRTRAFMANSIG